MTSNGSEGIYPFIVYAGSTKAALITAKVSMVYQMRARGIEVYW